MATPPNDVHYPNPRPFRKGLNIYVKAFHVPTCKYHHSHTISTNRYHALLTKRIISLISLYVYALWPRNEVIRTTIAWHWPWVIASGRMGFMHLRQDACVKEGWGLDAGRLGLRRAQRGIGCLPAMALTSICDGQAMYCCSGSLGREGPSCYLAH